MKKLLCTILVICMLISLTACSGKGQEEASAGFKPSLDTETNCKITVVGSYDNFEALEASFDRFNEHYPNVQLSYVKLDDYNNVLAAALDSSDKPNIFFSYTWMIGNEQYDPVIAHMEDLSDSALGLNLGCIRPGLINQSGKMKILIILRDDRLGVCTCPVEKYCFPGQPGKMIHECIQSVLFCG